MTLPSPPWILFLLIAQCAAIALILLALPFSPPVAGRMLLIPLGPQSAAQLVPDALAAGARLVDRGPVSGSLVVVGERAALAASLGNVMILAAPQSGCGRPGAPD